MASTSASATATATAENSERVTEEHHDDDDDSTRPPSGKRSRMNEETDWTRGKLQAITDKEKLVEINKSLSKRIEEAKAAELTQEQRDRLVRLGVAQARVNDRLEELAETSPEQSVEAGTGAHNRFNNLNTRELKDEFDAHYVDERGVVNAFKSFLETCWNLWQSRESEFFAPYTVVVQSSGYGKSRLIREFMTKHSSSAYLCVRNENQTGYPLETKTGAEALRKAINLANPKSAEKLPSSLHRFLHSTREQFMKCSVDVQEKFHGSDAVDGRWNEVLQSVLSICNQQPELKEKEKPASAPFYLFIDEADVLFNMDCKDTSRPSTMFRIFRRELKIFKKVFVVLLGTTSKLGNFVPSSDRDPSARPTKEEGVLFPPFVFTGTSDLCMLQYDDTARLLPPPATLLSLGRPLWTHATLSGEDQLQTLITFAKRKLNAGRPVKHGEREVCLASLCIRLSLSVCPLTSVAHNLVSDHMATLLAISEDRSLILMTYSSEPILAEAAAEVWHKDGLLWTDVFQELFDSFKYGVVSKGEIGEIIARLLLLLTVDDCRCPETNFYCTAVRLSDFLTKLAGSDIIDGVQLKNDLKDAHVAFTHFIPLEKSPTRETLCRLVRRCAAGILPPGHVGADLIIPIFTIEKEKQEIFSYIVVQVKNNKDGRVDTYDSTAGMYPDQLFDTDWMKDNKHVVSIFMQLGGNGAAPTFSKPASKRELRPGTIGQRKIEPCCSLLFRGLETISYGCLSNVDSSHLKRLYQLASVTQRIETWMDVEDADFKQLYDKKMKNHMKSALFDDTPDG